MQNNELATYKKNIEDAAKNAVIDSYADSLSEDILSVYRNDLDAYTAEDIDMRLTYAAKKAHPEIFSKQTDPQPAYVPKENEGKTGLESILSHYERKH